MTSGLILVYLVGPVASGTSGPALAAPLALAVTEVDPSSAANDLDTRITITGGNIVTVNGILWYATPVTVSQSLTATAEIRDQHTGDPAFALDGYHLRAGSAAIDKGVGAGITVDIDREPRPAGTGCDLGADEFMWYKVYLPLVVRSYQP